MNAGLLRRGTSVIRRRRVAQVAAGILAVAPLAARAQSPELAPAARVSGREDEILLKNGGMLRGTLVDVHPERPVVMVLAGTDKGNKILRHHALVMHFIKHPAGRFADEGFGIAKHPIHVKNDTVDCGHAAVIIAIARGSSPI